MVVSWSCALGSATATLDSTATESVPSSRPKATTLYYWGQHELRFKAFDNDIFVTLSVAK